MDQSTYIKKEIVVDGKHIRPITLDINYLTSRDNLITKSPIVIFCHGFKGFKDWGTFNLLAETFAKQNFVFIKFNFSHNGTSTNNFSDVHDLEAFGNNNFEIEQDDIGSILDWLESKDHEFSSILNTSEIYLIGHSRGGGMALLKSIEDSRVKKVAVWASLNELEKYMYLSNPTVWKEKGVSFVENSRTGLKLPLYYQFYENFYKNKARFDIKNNLMKLDKPLLLLHGTNDSIVPLSDAEWIYENVDHSILIKIEGGDHTFGGKHPWKKRILPKDLNFVAEETIEFFTF